MEVNSWLKYSYSILFLHYTNAHFRFKTFFSFRFEEEGKYIRHLSLK